jgi:hypothetical protein
MPDIGISDESAGLLQELFDGLQATHHEDGRTKGKVVDDAIRRVHRGFFGVDPKSRCAPPPTGPFMKYASDRPAEVLLRQIDPTHFQLAQPFRFASDDIHLEVLEDDVTDLASVPPYLTWLVQRYGPHTLAALLHDSVQPKGDETWADREDGLTSEKADELFRDSMGETGAPVVRRWVMWAAVALRTQVKFSPWPNRVRAVAWAVVFALVGLLVWPGAIATGGLDGASLAVLAVLAPVPLSLLVWWSRWRLGLLSGIALVIVVIPVLLVLVVVLAFRGVEWLFERPVPEERRGRIRVARAPAEPAPVPLPAMGPDHLV